MGSPLCRQMITLVDDLWPVNLSDKTLVSNDLKNIPTIKSKKARMNMVNGDRVHIAIKQQKLKCDVMSKQFKREVGAITNIISAMLETEAKRAIELEAKLDELEHFQNHRLQVKQK